MLEPLNKIDVIEDPDSYLRDIAATAREAVETNNPQVKFECIILLSIQTGRLTRMRQGIPLNPEVCIG